MFPRPVGPQHSNSPTTSTTDQPSTYCSTLPINSHHEVRYHLLPRSIGVSVRNEGGCCVCLISVEGFVGISRRFSRAGERSLRPMVVMVVWGGRERYGGWMFGVFFFPLIPAGPHCCKSIDFFCAQRNVPACLPACSFSSHTSLALPYATEMW